MVIAKRLAVLAIALSCSVALSTTFYVDPVNGSASGDGSQGNPWLTIDQVIDDGLIQSYTDSHAVKNAGAPVQGGDTLVLLDGYHGEISMSDYYNDVPITIEAAPGHTPRLRRVAMTDVKNWVIRGLDISPSNAPTYSKATCVSINTNSDSNDAARSRYVTIEDCFMYSVEDASGWSINDWINTAATGVGLHRFSRDLTIRNCHIKNVRFGISAGAHNSWIEGNLIENFSADGIRATSPGSSYINNIIRNVYVSQADGDSNHDDGIQGYLDYNPGGEVPNVVVRGNVIINRSDPDQPFQNTIQGIGCFDGPFINWTVENNLVVVDHWHGISLYTSRDCVIANNTVVNPYGTMTAWILYEGMAINNVIRNNITRRIDVSELTVVVENNLDLDFYNWDDVFVDWQNFDFRLKAGSPAIDAGTTLSAPDYDILGNPRPMGLGIDIGAYEYVDVQADPGEDIVVDDLLADGVETVTLDGGASTPADGATIVLYEWYEGTNLLGQGEILDVDLPVGEHVITLKVLDSLGNLGRDTFNVAVNGLIVADAGADLVVYDADANGFEMVQFDGTASKSSLSTISVYLWTLNGAPMAFVASPMLPVFTGTHTYQLEVVDNLGNSATDEVQVTVTDEPPLTPGDANGDEAVDIQDFVILKQNYGTSSGATWDQGDFNADGAVDIQDFVILKQNYGS